MRRLLLLALALLLGGCFGGDAPRVAQPTDEPWVPPVFATPTPTATPRTYDASDPGLNVTDAWHVGDGWDYESNGTPRRYRTERVVEELAAEDGRPVYKLQVTQGKVGASPDARDTWLVDGEDWTLTASIDQLGRTHEFQPPKPLRFVRNATFAYNESYVSLSGERSTLQYRVSSFLEPEWDVVRLPWGNEAAARTTHFLFSPDGGSTVVRTWWAKEYGNPVKTEVDDVGWTLRAADVGGRRFNVLQPT